MSNALKKAVWAAIGASAVVGILAILDLVIAIPFHGSMVLDIMFIVAAIFVGLMGWETMKELG